MLYITVWFPAMADGPVLRSIETEFCDIDNARILPKVLSVCR
jgi:hypothetical protein